MSTHTHAPREADDTNDEMFALAAALEVGDEIRVHAGEFIVDDVVEMRARPIIRVRKKSVGGYMDRTYRMESADPTDPDNDRIRIRTKYKSHWSEWCEFDPEKVLRDGESVVEPTPLVTDGGVVDTPSESEHAPEPTADDEAVIDTVADLTPGDEVTIEGRAKPFVVQTVGTRTKETRDGETVVQHGAKLTGTWAGATTRAIADVVNLLVGAHTDEIKFLGEHPRGVPRDFDVRRVGGADE